MFYILAIQNNIKYLTHETLLASWQKSIDLVWDSEHTAEILKEMGTNAERIFDISTKTIMFLESVDPGCTTDRITKIRAHFFHDDGTVTL